MADETTTANLFDQEAILQHWLGHRRLTRKTIEAFPEDKLFEFSIGGMRTFGQMAGELIGMALPAVDGLLTGEWSSFHHVKLENKADILSAWDAQTAELTTKVPSIPLSRLAEVHNAFGKWKTQGLELIQYVIDNEIHHRAEGFVYLRALGVEPTAFWDRQ